MAPRRKLTTPLGELLRQARRALSFDQAELASRVYVSSRQVSRWENGVPVADPKDRVKLFQALSGAPSPIREQLAGTLGIPLATQPSAADPAPAQRPAAELRASLEAVLYAASEQRDLLPRHLRAFAVELLHAVARLGLDASVAAALMAAPDRPKVSRGATPPA